MMFKRIRDRKEQNVDALNSATGIKNMFLNYFEGRKRRIQQNRIERIQLIEKVINKELEVRKKS